MPSKIQIKTAALGRLLKDHLSYQQEVTDNEAHLSTLTDEHERKQQQKVVDESKRVLPSVVENIKTTVKDLEKLIAEAETGVENEVKEAELKIQDAKKVL